MAKKRGASFASGNQLWRLRHNPVKPLRFKTPAELMNACIAYFAWLEENPLQEEKVFQYQGEIIKTDAAKMRMPTAEGLCVFLGIAKDTWYKYAKRAQFADAVEYVNSIMMDTKLTGAAAGLLDAGIVKAHLGLAEKRDLTSSDGSMSPPKIIKLIPKPCE